MDNPRHSIRRRVYWAWLRTVFPAFGPSLHRLVARFQDPEEIYQAARNGGLQTADDVKLSAEERRRLRNYANPQTVEENWRMLQDLKIGVVLREDPLYPPALMDLHDPPYLVYMRGQPQTLKNGQRLCVVGTRKPSAYGRNAALALSRQWSELGGVVVSGLALGIDALAHQGALDANAPFPTIAVLPGGLDDPHPRQNEALFHRIVEDGLLISENPPGFPLRPSTIPARNRLMAALGQGVLLVEAPLKSGTQYTVSAALDMGREVFAVPGQIDSPKAALPNQLIREGAKIVNDIRDIAEEYPAMRDKAVNLPPEAYAFPAKPPAISPAGEKKREKNPIVLSEKKRQDAPLDANQDSSKTALINAKIRPPLTETQQRILDAPGGKSAGVDALVLRCQLPVHILLRELSRLQAAGWLQCDALGQYRPPLRT